MNWQPIETAPKDGTELLLWTPRRGFVRGKWKDDQYSKRPRPYWTNDSERIFGVIEIRADQPTHWMIPDPPK